MRRYLVPLIFGIGGVAILVSLGVWQIQRLAWKQGVLAEINARMSGNATSLDSIAGPLSADVHNYQRIAVSATPTGREVHVLTSQKFKGAGYRVLAEMDGSDQSLWVDLGFVGETRKDADRPTKNMTIDGNLLWPDDYDPSFTPNPDVEKNIWFARHIPHLAEQFGGNPVLVVASDVAYADGTDYDATELWPVDTAGIPNDHLQYAITWFSLAIVWAGMTAFLLWRIRGRTSEMDE